MASRDDDATSPTLDLSGSCAHRRCAFDEETTVVQLMPRKRKRYALRLDLDAELPDTAELCAPRALMVF